MMMLRSIQCVHGNAASARRARRCRRDAPRPVACRAEEELASPSSSAPCSRGESSEGAGGPARAAAACAAVVLSLASGAQPALAGGYGTGFGYFEALERERRARQRGWEARCEDERVVTSQLRIECTEEADAWVVRGSEMSDFGKA